jgi:hypothetical protein
VAILASIAGRRQRLNKFAEKVRFRRPAPKGATDFGGLTASLKRCPDTKLRSSAICKAGAENKLLIAAVNRCATQKQVRDAVNAAPPKHERNDSVKPLV